MKSPELLGLVGLMLLACQGQGQTTPASTPPPTPPAPKAIACQQDADCTGGWTPDVWGCGKVERCLAGQCALPGALTGKPDDTTGRLVFETAHGPRGFQVEVVIPPFETARGMMCRTEVASGWGMLFLLEETRVQSFWMKNTLIPLDMVFLDEAWRVVGVVERAEPKSLDARQVDGASRYVLELAGGEAAKAELKPGDQARFLAPKTL